MACECINIEFLPHGELTSTTIQVDSVGTYNGEYYYHWTHSGVDYYLYWNLTGNQWEVTINGLGYPTFPLVCFWKETTGPCPPLGAIS